MDELIRRGRRQYRAPGGRGHEGGDARFGLGRHVTLGDLDGRSRSRPISTDLYRGALAEAAVLYAHADAAATCVSVRTTPDAVPAAELLQPHQTGEVSLPSGYPKPALRL